MLREATIQVRVALLCSALIQGTLFEEQPDYALEKMTTDTASYSDCLYHLMAKSECGGRQSTP